MIRSRTLLRKGIPNIRLAVSVLAAAGVATLAATTALAHDHPGDYDRHRHGPVRSGYDNAIRVHGTGAGPTAMRRCAPGIGRRSAISCRDARARGSPHPAARTVTGDCAWARGLRSIRSRPPWNRAGPLTEDFPVSGNGWPWSATSSGPRSAGPDLPRTAPSPGAAGSYRSAAGADRPRNSPTADS